MSNIGAEVARIEREIERALWAHEVPGALDQALAAYTAAREELLALDVSSDPAAGRAQSRVLAYCLMRMGNVLRQLGRHGEAAALAEQELSAARASGDALTLGRSLMSHGVTALRSGARNQGLAELEEAREAFERGSTPDHVQGLGWYWILQADLRNAGLVPGGPEEALAAADRARELLLPIENWPGVARAHAARARAHDARGDARAAAEDRARQEHYERLTHGENRGP